MTNPIRLVDDPGTPGPLRQALQAELGLPTLADRGALRAALLQQAGAATTAGAVGAASGWGATSQILAGVVLTTAIVVGAGYVALRPEGAATAPSALNAAPVAAPTPEADVLPALQIEVPFDAPEPAAEAQPPAEDEARSDDQEPAAATETPRRRRPPRPSDPPATAAAPPVVNPSLAGTPAADETHASELSEQLRRYRLGVQQLKAGTSRQAVATFDTYLRDYPDGELRIEANLSLLEALLRAGERDRAATLASGLAADPAYVARRGELLRVQADLLVQQGRCPEAREVYHRAITLNGSGLSPADIENALARCQGTP